VTAVPLDLHLHDAQGRAFRSEATEILYGGAAGGGKSHLMRVAAIVWCAAIPGLQVYLFRRVREDLLKNHLEGPQGFRALLAPWANAGLCRVLEDEIRFWNGAKIWLCHCKDEATIYRYQGAEIHVLLIDELTHFTEAMYRYLRHRVRMVGIGLPEPYAGLFPRVLCSANPGGVGHLWVKSTWVDAGPWTIRRMPREEGGLLRQFIPARLEDNPSMAIYDPDYEKRLEGLGSKALVQAMRWGDWDIVEGAFFDCWDKRRHVIRPFEIPEHWLRFRSGDWGSAKPFSFGWWAVASEDTPVENEEGQRLWLPRGCMVRYREWYGCRRKEDGTPIADTGLKLDAEEVGRRLAGMEPEHPPVTYGVLDPAAFAVDGGPSIAERIYTGSGRRIRFRPADNARVPQRGAMGGWDQMRGRLVGDADGRPMVVCFSTCKDSIRTIPVLQHDPDRPEDVDTEGEDHCFAAGTRVLTPDGPVPIESLPPVGLVLSADGFRHYRSARLTRRNAETVRLTFEDGTVICCTPDHRFLEDTGEWRYAADLVGRSVRCAPLSSAPPFKSSTASVITSAGGISSGRASASISLFGNTITGLFHQAITSITGLGAAPTTHPRTLSASRLPNTWATATGPRAGNVAGAASPRPSPPPPRGMAARTGAAGIANTTSGTSAPSWISGFLRRARNAAAAIWSAPPGLSRDGSVPAPARRVRCVAVEEAGRADVYCLTVPATGCFAIEGGLLVSNCADEWRYACMSRPWVRPAPEQDAPRFEYGVPGEGTPFRVGATIRELIERAERKARQESY